ncbi:MAG: HPr family phosphocarrier protein [Candidatus Aminicenantes bacterium]|nr:HPr family phosphocarrier protein [Candidatus Aminicenantes bacterium]
MVSKEVVIRNELGLHARAAAKFVNLANRFASAIRVSRDTLTVDGKSIMGVLLLAATCGTALTLTAEGEDEQKAIAALSKLVERDFKETG